MTGQIGRFPRLASLMATQQDRLIDIVKRVHNCADAEISDDGANIMIYGPQRSHWMSTAEMEDVNRYAEIANIGDPHWTME